MGLLVKKHYLHVVVEVLVVVVIVFIVDDV